MSRPRVKICGITSIEDARRAVELGADYLGLNFYPPSPRYLSVGEARKIADAVRGSVQLVGVFVDRPLTEVLATERAVGLDLLQFHGSESAEQLAPVAERAIKVFRLRASTGVPDLEQFESVWGFLFDAAHARLYGGSGRRWRYERIAELTTSKPVLVAGGVGPGTASKALELSRAWGVDVCSGVESAPGVKDERLMRDLFLEMRDVDV